MTARLLLLADTHVPKRAKDLPGQVWQAVDEADLVLHAGDWVDVWLLDALESRASGWWGWPATTTTASCVSASLSLPTSRWRSGSVLSTRLARRRDVKRAVRPDTRVLMFSSSATATSRRTRLRQRGLRLLNPGSPTDRRRRPSCTYMTVTVHEGVLRSVMLRVVTTPAE